MKPFPFKQARNYTKGRIKPVQLIVLHSMESPERVNTAENVAAYFAGSSAPMASAHYCVDADSVVQCVKLTDTAYHCKNANANGIGIEHAGYAKQTKQEWLDTYGKAMLELSAQLTADLCEKYNIPARRAQFASKDNPRVVSPGICGHADVPNHGSHWDPGPNWPWDYYLERVKFYLDGSLSAANDIQDGGIGKEESSELSLSSSPVASPIPAAEDSPPQQTASMTLKDGDMEMKTSGPVGSPETVYIEKPAPLGFAASMKTKISTVVGGNVTLQVVRDYAEQAKAIGLSPRFWLWISIFAVVGGLVWLAVEVYRHWSANKRELEITKELVTANSTSTNTVALISSADIPKLPAKDVKIVRR